MTLTERHSQILDILHKQGSVSVLDLANQLDVSSVTIRKDLSFLEQKELLYRTHGSAILINPYINDRHVNVKEKLYMEEKRLIGIRAAELITTNDSIIIASGTTIHAFARQIQTKEHLTVISAALNVTNILARNKNIDIIQLGGFVRNTSLSTVGNYAEKMLEDFSCSKLYIGVDGIDLDYGLTTTNAMEATLNRVMMKVSQKTIVLADSSKFGRRGFSKICDLNSVDHIITDKNISQKTLDGLHEHGIEVSIV
ncbi:MAG: DeoR/GlpR family DNA-binding transcription regulator [Prevotellaceae bacterium]|jgi:DeoR family transcriptional regulator of aga operon|nr:DeoR/GlpR family DNA-binding transcription regulator [Prevotellaceae bacterium]